LAEANVVVIDNSSAFRYDEAVPLCIPEINLASAMGKKLIANPNCTTAIALMVLAPIHSRFKIKRVIMSTYQSASGAGQEGMNELITSMIFLCNEDYGIEPKVFPHQLCCNIIPLIDVVLKNSYSKEEMKVVWETRKILNEPVMLISCTAVRVPTLRSHCEAITIETEEPITAKEVTDILSQSRGVKVVDDPKNNLYPMPLSASGKYDVEVGRIRENPVFGNCGLDLFIAGDQLLRGSALNAVLIAEGVLYPKI
jgi:aspartate-semialdehyde dehydrogenase